MAPGMAADMAPAWRALSRAYLRMGRMTDALNAKIRWEELGPLSDEKKAFEAEFSAAGNLK